MANIFEIKWQSIPIQITHTPQRFATVDHIELKANQRLPITETGYRSIFLTERELIESGGVLALVESLLEEGAKTQEWEEYKEQSRQTSLF